MIGLPEARIILSQAVTYCATAPKSNAALQAIELASADVAKDRVQPIPLALRDAHYKGAETLGHGVGYVNPHDAGGLVAPGLSVGGPALLRAEGDRLRGEDQRAGRLLAEPQEIREGGGRK